MLAPTPASPESAGMSKAGPGLSDKRGDGLGLNGDAAANLFEHF